jgi:hypothetical protein
MDHGAFVWYCQATNDDKETTNQNYSSVAWHCGLFKTQRVYKAEAGIEPFCKLSQLLSWSLKMGMSS